MLTKCLVKQNSFRTNIGPTKKQLDDELKIKLNGKKLYEINSVKHHLDKFI